MHEVTRRSWVLLLAITFAIAVASVAAANGLELWPPVRWTFSADGGFLPKALPREEPAPISFFLSGRIESQDGSIPPRLETFEVEGDKHVAIDVKGLPVCAWKDLRSADTAQVRRACGGALVGSGMVKLGIRLSERVIPVKSELLVINGGFKGGVTTLFLHAYNSIPTPTPAAIVAPVKIEKIARARYGLRATASIPTFAGGGGKVESFSLNIQKGILTATCGDRRLQAVLGLDFADGTELSGTLFSPCVPKG
jgi:hypothetical protein